MDRKIRFILFVGVVVIGIVFACVFAVVASSDGLLPEGVEKYNPDPGWFCIRDVKLGIHFCEFIDPCCAIEGECYEEITIATPTPGPGPDPTPTNWPVPSPTPEPAERPKANCGLGNLEEGADPNENACGPKTGEENEPSGPPGQNKNK